MAREPYSGTATVEPTPAPSDDYQRVDASPASFGGVAAGAEQQAGARIDQGANDLAQTAILKQDRFNQTTTDNAFNQFQQGADNLTYGNPTDPTAPKGLYTLRGSDALNAGPGVVQSISSLRDQIKSGLQNDAQRLQFDEASRRLTEYKSAEISRHLDQQSDVYGLAVNKATMENAARSASNAYNSDDAIMHSIQDSRSGAVKSAQITAGVSAGPEVIKNALAASDTYVIKGTVLGAMAQGDYGRAAQIMDKFGSMVDPAERAELSRMTKEHGEAAQVSGAAQGIITGTPFTPMSGADSATVDKLDHAIHGQESGGAADSVTSVDHAVGGHQIIPSTFQQYARPGENINNPADNAAVGKRIVADLTQRYNGDPARVAVAYFSGPNNVSPPGSPTPWIRDAHDGNGTATSTYTNNILARLGAPAIVPGAAPASATAKPTGTDAPDEIVVPQNLPPIQSGSYQYISSGNMWQSPDGKLYDSKGQPTSGPSASQPSSPNHNPAAFTTEQQMIQNAQTEAQRRFPDRPDLQQRTMEQVYQHISQTNVLQAKYEAEQTKALREAQENAANGLVTTLLKDPTNFDPQTIANNPSLTAEQKLTLNRAAREEMTRAGSMSPSSATYGAGFTQLYARVTAPDGNPARLTDATELWKDMASGQLTPAGYEKLNAALVGRRTPDGEAEVQLQKQFLHNAHGELTGTNDGLGLKDPKGEEIYLRFMATAFPAIQAAKAAGKTPQQIYDPTSPDYVGKIIPGMKRSPAQYQLDVSAANGGGAAPPSATPGSPTLADLQAEVARRGLLNPPLPVAKTDTGPVVPH